MALSILFLRYLSGCRYFDGLLAYGVAHDVVWEDPGEIQWRLEVKGGLRQ
jgi:hypothetical protein